MTRQERLTAIAEDAGSALIYGRAVASMIETDDTDTDKRQQYAKDAAHYGHIGIDHLAALEQQAIAGYLADVPLPEGWREEVGAWGHQPEVRYWWTPDDDVDMGSVERAMALRSGVKIFSTPRHWPAIPLPVLIRAAVQCHRLREGQ